MPISFEPIHFYVSLIILALLLVAVWMRYRDIAHILFCAIFGVYLIGVIRVAVFPFFVFTDGYKPDLLRSVNLIPFNFGSCFEYLPQNCWRDIYDNILLTIPFGFGIHFITRIKPKYVPWLILAIGCSFEFIQFIMLIVFRTSSRAIDINDVILNAIGAFIGYILFKLFGWLYLLAAQKFNLQLKHIFAYIHDVIHASQQTDHWTLK